MKRAVIGFVMIALLMLSGCAAGDNTTFNGANGKWFAKLTDKFEAGISKNTDTGLSTSFKGTDGMDLVIVENTNPGYVASEERLQEETTAIDEIEPTRAEVLTIENFGEVYGAVVTDHQMGTTMFYYMTNVDTDVIYFLFIMKEGYLSEAREGEIKSIITSLSLK